MQKIEKYLREKPPITPAVVCFLVKDSLILLGLRKAVSLGLGKNLVGGIGGKVGDKEGFENETEEEAMKREVLEEIGVTIIGHTNMGRVLFLYPHKPKWNQDVYVFLVHEWFGEPTESDVIKPVWYEINNLPVDRMWADNAHWVPRIISGQSVNGAFLFDEEGKIAEFTLK